MLIRNIVIACAVMGIALMAAKTQAAPSPASYQARVVGVLDGDTLKVLDANRQEHRIRLARIDAPEKAQAFGTRAKISLSELCFGRQATIEEEDRDRYGRVVARVICGGEDANLAQVKRGMAHVYEDYLKTKRSDRQRNAALASEYLAAQAGARQSRTGLWSDPSPMAPKDFRHR